jgi:hypothetical protein
MQLSLFPSTVPIIAAPRACTKCGSASAVLKSSCGPHAGEFRCALCDTDIKWASHADASAIRAGFVSGLSSAGAVS